MDAAEFKFYTEEQIRRQSLADKPFFRLGNVFEDHHYLGWQNNPRTYNIHKERHDFITNRLNYYRRNYRQEPVIQLLVNIIGALELLAFELNQILFLIKDNPAPEMLKRELANKQLAVDQVINVVKLIMEGFEHDTRKNLHTYVHPKERQERPKEEANNSL